MAMKQRGQEPMNTLKPQPGQTNSYAPKFHPLPGDWAKEQLLNPQEIMSNSREISGAERHGKQTEIQRALQAEATQHSYWEKWQGVTPGKPAYENPREEQETTLPSAKYGTEGSGYG